MMSNGAMQTTAKFATVTTGTSIKTMQQVKPGTTQCLAIIEWGIAFDGSAAGVGITVELIETDVAATVTAYVANDITKVDALALLSGDPTTNIIAVGTTSSGYTSTSEGSITAVRNLAAPVFLQPTGPILIQLPLDQEGIIQPSKFGRIRVHAPAAVNCYSWMKVKT